MRLSVGLLYDSIALLEACRVGPTTGASLAGRNLRLDCAPVQDVCSFAAACSWVALKGEEYHITDTGLIVLEESKTELRLRSQLADYISTCRPPWGPLIRHGVAEVAQALSIDEFQCFREAGLLNAEEEGAVEWWDQQSVINSDSDHLLEVGRAGERLSIHFELSRTGRRPRWIAFESNYAGYDLLSIVGRDRSTELRIEVKASERPWESAVMELSAHEWEVALSEGSHQFHIWLLKGRELLVLDKEDLSHHIPRNSGRGSWTTTRIPYNAFGRELWRPAFMGVSHETTTPSSR